MLFDSQPIKGHQSQPCNPFPLLSSLQDWGFSSCFPDVLVASPGYFGPQGKDPKQRSAGAPKAEPQLCISMLGSRTQEGNFVGQWWFSPGP